MFDTYQVVLEVYNSDTLIQQQVIEAPKVMIMGSFMNLAQAIANDSRPMRVRLARPVPIQDNFEQRQINLTNEIVLSNKAMTSAGV